MDVSGTAVYTTFGKDSIESKDVDGEISSSLNLDINKRLAHEISNLEVNKDDSIDMEKIQNAIVPIIENVDIFISYDHKDEEKAKIIASSVMKKNRRIFLDSLFWSSLDKELYNFNVQRNKKDGKLDYAKIMQAASTFHMILSDSIVETVKNSRIFVFIRDSESPYDSRTVSPWIYLENKVANSIQTEKLEMILENFQYPKRITFDIDTFGYQKAKNVHDIVELAEAVLK